MSKVELVKKISLNATSSQKFSIDWSSDYKIAVCTDQCIFILSSRVSPLELSYPLPLHQQVIKVQKELLNFKLLKNILPMKEMVVVPDYLQEVILDRTLLPDIDAKPSYLIFKLTKWSAKGATKSGNCFLATLGMDHRLLIYEEQGEDWEIIADLSEILFQSHLSIWKQEYKDDELSKLPDNFYISIRDKLYNKNCARSEVQKQKKRLYNLAAMDMTWTNVFGSATTASSSNYKWSYLIVAMKSGNIVWWKVSPDDGEVISLAYEWETDFGKITSLCWQQLSQNSGFLCCGTLSGKLAFTRIVIQAEGRQLNLCFKSTNWILNTPEHIAVNNICILKTSVQKYIIVCNKQYLMYAAEVCVQSSEITIKNISFTETLGNLPVTGCSVIDSAMPQSHILYSTMSGELLKVKILSGSTGFKFQCEPLQINIDIEHNIIRGLGTSPNGLLCALILNISSWYNHLLKKEPVQFVIFLTKSYDKIFMEFEQVLKPQFPFMQTSTNSVFRYIDYFECSRMYLANEPTLPKLFTDMLNIDTAQYQQLNSNEMFFMRFLLKTLLSGFAEAANSLQKEELNIWENKLAALETVILAKYIQTMLSNYQEKLDLVSPAQAQSLLLMGDWLYMQYKTPINMLYEAFGHECPPSPEDIPPRETCRICKLPVKLENFQLGSCVNKHTFARCCLSLLLCDTLPYDKCSSCNSLALQDVWIDNRACTFCSLPLVGQT